MRNAELLQDGRRRTVRLGVLAAFLGWSLRAVILLVTSAPAHQVAISVVGAALAAGMAAVELRASGTWTWHRAVDLWMAGNVVLVLLAGSADAESDAFYAVLLLIAFGGALYRLRGQLVLTALTSAAYALVVVLGGVELSGRELLARATTLLIAALIAAHLTRELHFRAEAHDEAVADSRRQAALIATVAESARSINQLDPTGVFEAVSQTVLGMGFEMVGIAFPDFEQGTYRYEVLHGVNRELLEGSFSLAEGTTGAAFSSGHTVVIEDYEHSDAAVATLRGLELHTVFSTPIHCRGELAAVMAGATTHRLHLTEQDIETIELLASHAGRALENARTFEAEREAVERLTELDQMKRDFLSTVSHELRTPLTVIRGMLETLDRRWSMVPEEQRREFVARASRNAVALDDVITALLDFSRLESGSMELRPVPFPLEPAVRDVADRLSSLLADHVLALDVGPAVVLADPVLVERVVENLLSNAAKYTPRGTRVRITARSVDERVEVAVGDTGPGIAPDDLDRIGQRFFRAGDPNTRAVRGVGLGLAFVREVLAMHGSELDVASEVGVGSSFSFRLPAGVVDPVELEPSRSTYS